jgi:polysaccharide export outer membrane protein
MNTSSYYIYPNDVIIVDPNNTKVKSAGLVGNVGTVLTVTSVLLSTIILLTR